MLNSLLFSFMPALALPGTITAQDDLPRLSLNRKQENTIITALNSKNEISRISAVEKIEKYNIRKAAAHLIEKLKDESPKVRAEIIQALGNFKLQGVAPRIYKILLHDPSPLVRAKSAVALGKLNYEPAKASIFSLIDRPDIRERIAAVRALGMMGGKKVFRILVKMLRKPNSEIRETAIHALGLSGNNKAVYYLKKYLDNKNPQIKGAAITALSNLKPDHIKPHLCNYLLQNNLVVQKAALKAITLTQEKSCNKNLTFLLQKGRDNISASTASVLAILGIKHNNNLILRRLNSNPNLSAKIRYYWALARLGDLRILPKLYQNLDSSVPELRLISLKSMKLLRPQSDNLAKMVYPLINDKEISVAAEAVKLLAEYGEKKILNNLDKNSLKNKHLIKAYAYAIAKFGQKDEKTLNILKTWLKMNSVEVKTAVVEALGRLHDSNLVAKLLSFLYHQNSRLKQASILSLAQIKAKYVVSTLKFLLKREHSPLTTAYIYLAYSIYGISSNLNYKLISNYNKSLTQHKPILRFIYAFALLNTKYKKRDEVFKSSFEELFFKGYNHSIKEKYLELLLLKDYKWSKGWLEKAVFSPLYRVQSAAMLLLSRFRKQKITKQVKNKKKIENIQKKKKKEEKLHLPFSHSGNKPERGCNCNHSNPDTNPTLIIIFILCAGYYRFKMSQLHA
ncbi:MAG: HEAT repeat domain-containing protein [Deltaproteobacteria bacterium]|jgi:HEAT repeat protein|nr:HEAT repeat domain-containing protein [Deltaproteobacteria bacterium]